MVKEETAKKIRCFIALELSSEAKEELRKIIDVLKPSGADIKWVSPESMHLTLKFLGSIEEEKAGKIAARLKGIAQGKEEFDVLLGGIGVFPGWERARVLWVGAGEGEEETKRIAGEVEDAMAEEGFEKESRPFSVHLTLGRMKSGKNKDKLKSLADEVEVESAPSHIDRIVLFKSDLTPKGAIYTALDTADFTG